MLTLIPLSLFALPADISFIAVDLKYNSRDGVKICEIQPVSESNLSGYDEVKGASGELAKRFTDIIAQYHLKVWTLQEAFEDKELEKRFDVLGWSAHKTLDKTFKNKAFQKAASLNVQDPTSISNYHGILYTPKIKSVSSFKEKYTGILLLDAAIFSIFDDKYLVSNLMRESPLKEMRPRWNLYEKKYSKELVRQIHADIPSNLMVIKPRGEMCGRGVIILKRCDLEETLKYILTDKKKLKKDPDASYNTWGRNKDDHFLVEEYIESDPVVVPHFNQELYDGTMRVVLLLICDRNLLQIHSLGAYWKLPKASLSSDKSLIERHRSFGESPHFLKVDPALQHIVEETLIRSLPYLYQQLL